MEFQKKLETDHVNVLELDVKLWKGLKYWKTGEWQFVDESLKHLDRMKEPWNPGRKNLFRALDLCPLEDTKVVIFGQDPYPNPEFATGLAFDVGSNPVYPPSMRTILRELKDDLGIIHTGNLSGWASQGVLLWNVVPSCDAGKSLSHTWVEWEPLTVEIIEVLNPRNIVFCFVGSYPKHFLKHVDTEENEVICVGHPSPLNRTNPFYSSRFFSSINDKLTELGRTPIDWRL